MMFKLRCPSCNFIVSHDAKICSNCGHETAATFGVQERDKRVSALSSNQMSLFRSLYPEGTNSRTELDYLVTLK